MAYKLLSQIKETQGFKCTFPPIFVPLGFPRPRPHPSMVFMRFRPQLIFSSLPRSIPKPRTPPAATLAAAAAAARRRHHTTVVATSMAATSEDALRRALAERQAAVDAQAEAVRALKAGGGASKADVDAAVEALKALKVEAGAAARRLQQAVGAGAGGAAREELRQAVVNTLERKLFYIPSFKIYRGVAGLYDYGPPGCRVKANVLSFWRQVTPAIYLQML